MRSAPSSAAGWRSHHSVAAARRAPRYTSSSERPCSIHARAATRRSRPTTRSARALSNQRCNRGQALKTTSWAISTLCAVADHEPCVDERIEDRPELARDLVEGNPPADPAALVGDVGEQEQRPPSGVLDRRVPRTGVEHSGPQALDGRRQPTELPVALDGQHIAVAPFPELGEGGRDERQGAVGVADVSEHGGRQVRVDTTAGPDRRLLDDPAQLVVARASDEQQLRLVDELGQVPSLGQLAVLVGADDEHDVRIERRVEGNVDQPCDERVRRSPAGGRTPPRTGRRRAAAHRPRRRRRARRGRGWDHDQAPSRSPATAPHPEDGRSGRAERARRARSTTCRCRTHRSRRPSGG